MPEEKYPSRQLVNNVLFDAFLRNIEKAFTVDLLVKINIMELKRREQFQQFRRRTRKMGVLYSAVQDKNSRKAVIDLMLPVTEIERANAIFEQIHFATEQENMTEKKSQGKEREPKNAFRSELDSRATRDSSSTWNEKTKMTNDRPSVE